MYNIDIPHHFIFIKWHDIKFIWIFADRRYYGKNNGQICTISTFLCTPLGCLTSSMTLSRIDSRQSQ